MNSFTKSCLLIAFVLFANFFLHGYQVVGPVEKKYQTKAQKRKLFNDVGCRYSNELNIEYPAFDSLKAKKSELYAFDKDLNDRHTRTYAGAIQMKYRAPMYLKWISDVVGYGIFAGDDIKKGDLIGEYSGVLREVKKAPDNLDYAWYYSLDGVDGKKLVVDGKYQGNELRFINHADDPNTIRIDVLGRDGIFHVVYVASKDITKDEQLTVSYGEGYFTSRSMTVVAV